MEHYDFELIFTLSDINGAAEKLWQHFHNYRVFAFSGEMGAGKTTFIHHLCDYLKVPDAVSSPTFALINEYHFADDKGDNTIYHMDWYRLRDTEEAINAGLEDCMKQAEDGYARCFVEWPEKAGALLRPPYIWISIAALDDATRKLQVRKVG